MFTGVLYLVLPDGDTIPLLSNHPGACGTPLVLTANISNDPRVKAQIHDKDTVTFMFKTLYYQTSTCSPTGLPASALVPRYTGPNRSPLDTNPDGTRIWLKTDRWWSPAKLSVIAPYGNSYQIGRRWSVAGWILQGPVGSRVRTDTVQVSFEDVAGDNFTDLMFTATGLFLIRADRVSPAPPTIAGCIPAICTNDQVAQVTLSGSGFTGGGSVRLVKAGKPGIAGTVQSSTTSSIVCTFAIAGVDTGTRDIIVVNSDGQSDTLLQGFSIIAACTMPLIGTQPTPQAVTAPGTATFTVTVAGTGLSCQWQRAQPATPTVFANVTTGTGGTTATYTTTATTVATDNGAQYRCVATNSCGNTITNVVTLTVNAGAVFTANKAQAIKKPGIYLLKNPNGVIVTAHGEEYRQFNVSIYSTVGKLVNIFEVHSNNYPIVWNYSDCFGDKVHAGLYLIQVKTGNKTVKERVLVGR
jgi:hypothetical protein